MRANKGKSASHRGKIGARLIVKKEGGLVNGKGASSSSKRCAPAFPEEEVSKETS